MTTLSDEKRLPWLLMTPALIIILLIGVFPLFYNLYLSLHFWNMTRPDMPIRFIWFKNYTDLFGSTIFWEAFGRTMIFLASAVTLEMVLGFGLAMLFNRDFKGKSIAFPIVLIPMITTPIVVGLIWRYMYNGEFGFVSWILTYPGFFRTRDPFQSGDGLASGHLRRRMALDAVRLPPVPGRPEVAAPVAIRSGRDRRRQFLAGLQVGYLPHGAPRAPGGFAPAHHGSLQDLR